MLCAPIKLTNRTLKPGELDVNKYRSKLLNEKIYLKSDYYHSYTFRWDRSKKYIGTPTNTNHSLAVNNILLPENIPAFNTGSSMQKWSSKRPRLKSSKNKPYYYNELSANEETESEETFDVTTLIQRFSQEVESEQNDEKIQEELYEFEEEEIDPDIQRLITISQGSSSEQDEDHSRKNKKKHKKKEGKEKKIKTIRFSLSKPPSPQTVQVIRVDVTSNYSWEEEMLDINCKEKNKDCSKGCGKRIRSGLATRKAKLKKQFSIHDEDGDDVDLLCKKLSLMERNDEDDDSL